jgi:hypothetical protein
LETGDFGLKTFLDCITSIHVVPFDGLESILVGFHGCQGAVDDFLLHGDLLLGPLLLKPAGIARIPGIPVESAGVDTAGRNRILLCAFAHA